MPTEGEVGRDGKRRAASEDAVDVDRLVPVLSLHGLVPAAVLGVNPDADAASVRDMDVHADVLPLPHHKDRGKDAPPRRQPAIRQGALLFPGPGGRDA
jgi:hypothetical protein